MDSLSCLVFPPFSYWREWVQLAKLFIHTSCECFFLLKDVDSRLSETNTLGKSNKFISLTEPKKANKLNNWHKHVHPLMQLDLEICHSLSIFFFFFGSGGWDFSSNLR